MKRDEVIALTIEAGFDDIDTWINGEDVPFRQVEAAKRWLERATELVNLAYQCGMSDEREECAKLATTTVCDTHIPTGVNIYGTRVAAAIRARTTTTTK